MSILVDSHAHLDFPDFEGQQEALVTRALEARVKYILTVCTKIQEFSSCRAIAERFDNVYCSVGTHPHHAADIFEQNVSLQDLIKCASHPKNIAIGESGFDFFGENFVPYPIQLTIFQKHVFAAQRTGLPLIVHSRQAEEETLSVLSEEKKKADFRAVLHCFSSEDRLAEEGIELGFYVSFSGILTFKNSDRLRALAKRLPIERILIETDAPYLSPVPFRGKRNEPAHVVQVANCLAELKGMEYEEIAEVTTKNFFRLFDKAIL